MSFLRTNLIRFRFVFFAIALLAGAWGIWKGQNLQFDRSIENMFSSNDPVLAPYDQLKRTFGGNEVVLAVYDDEQLLTPEGIARLSKIRETLEAVDGVKSVLSLDRPLGPAIIQNNAVAEHARDLFEGYTHSADGKMAALGCMLVPKADAEVPRVETVRQLRAALANLPAEVGQGMLIGEPVMIVDGFRYIERDGEELVRWSAGLLAITILVFFRSLRWVLLPFVVVVITLAITRGILVSIGMQLSMVSSMLTAVVTVVAVATIVHVIVKFREAQRHGATPLEATSQTIDHLAVPIFWACLTDVVAFLSLIIAKVGPVQDYGVMMSIGGAFVLVTTALVSPTIMLAGQSSDDTNARKTNWIGDQLGTNLDWTLRNTIPIGLVLLSVTLISLFGLSRLVVETDFSRNFQPDSEIVRAYELVETRLGGAGVCDIVIPAPKPLTAEFLESVRQLQDRLRDEFSSDDPTDTTRPLSKVISLADATLVKPSSKTLGADFIVQRQLSLARQPIPDFFDALYAEDPSSGKQYFRIMLRARERQSAAQKRAFVQRIQKLADEEFPQQRPTVTGFFVLLADLIESVLRDQWRTFALALVAIGLMMIAAFRDLRLAMIALLPNALPILIVTGCMGWISSSGWFNLKANMGTAMIAAVSIGLSVDSSIHYIKAYQRARFDGLNVYEALQRTHRTVGRALIFSTLALIVGFTVLVSSDFLPTVYFGCLVSVAMAGGLLGNMLILPALIRLTSK